MIPRTFKSGLLIGFCCLILASLVQADALDDGQAAFDAKQYQQAFTLWSPLAKKGNPDAEYNLGLLYMNGLGVKKNDRLALMWFIRAGQQGMADAQYNAGVMYYLGQGVYPSFKSAIAWWQLAANKGHANAENNLAAMYAYGYGVGVDQKKAIALWTDAAEQGLPNAINALIEVYSGKLAGFKADPTKEKFWRQKKAAR